MGDVIMGGLDLTRTPAQYPPPGVTPNLVDPFENVWPARVLSISFLLLAGAFLAARLFVKLRIVRKMQLEDYFLVIGWIGFAILDGLSAAATVDGAGRHQWDVSLLQFARFLWLVNSASITYNIAIIFAKYSILLQLERIFTGTRKDIVYWSIQVLKVLNTLFYVANIFTAIFACTPREKIWFVLEPGTCINVNASIVVSAAFNLGSDVALLIIPLYAISRLQITRKRRWGVLAVFATGALGCISSALRLYYSTILLGTSDVTMIYIIIDIVANAEFACIIMVPCFPVLPRLYLYRKQKPTKVEDLYSRYDLKTVRISGPRPVYIEKQKLGLGETTKDFEVPPPVPPKSWLDLDRERDGAVSPLSERSVSDDLEKIASIDKL